MLRRRRTPGIRKLVYNLLECGDRIRYIAAETVGMGQVGQHSKVISIDSLRLCQVINRSRIVAPLKGGNPIRRQLIEHLLLNLLMHTVIYGLRVYRQKSHVHPLQGIGRLLIILGLIGVIGFDQVLICVRFFPGVCNLLLRGLHCCVGGINLPLEFINLCLLCSHGIAVLHDLFTGVPVHTLFDRRDHQEPHDQGADQNAHNDINNI